MQVKPQEIFENPPENDPALVAPLVLAYLGDTVYDLYVRTRLVQACHAQTGQLHKMAVRYVCAGGQAKALQGMMEELTPEELAIVRRGRNAKSMTLPKHSSVQEYRYATAFEALLGYLYLAKQHERAQQIMQQAFDLTSRDQEEKNAAGKT